MSLPNYIQPRDCSSKFPKFLTGAPMIDLVALLWVTRLVNHLGGKAISKVIIASTEASGARAS